MATPSNIIVLQDLKKTLLKELPAESPEAVEHCRDVLQQLQSFDITLSVLQETLIGAAVAKFKKHDQLGDIAKQLIKKWKQIAAKEEPPKSSKSTAASGDNDDDGNAASNASPEAEWAHLPPHRQNICKKMYEYLLVVKSDLVKSGINASAIDQLMAPRAAEIEQATYENTASDKSAYAAKARTLAFNLRKNKALTADVCLGQLPTKDLVTMSNEQLASAETIKARQEEAKKLLDSKRLDWDQANEAKINEMCGIKGELLKASLFTCGRCKSVKTTSTQKQTRSADEPMTVFVLCLNCGKRWKC